jgi:hypothetical protein
MSLTDHWELAVEIPINPLSGSVQSVTGSAVDNTDPLNPVINEIIFGVQNIIAGTNITVDNTDPANPIISATGGGGSQTLAEVLLEGNITDGTDISISDGDKIVLDNGANLKKGTTDAGLGGTKGIALRCAVDYELKWEAGRLYVMGGDGFTIREVSHNFTTTPTATDDDTKGFVVDSRWILDNGDVYICTDATTGNAVWELYSVGATPTLQEVLIEDNKAENISIFSYDNVADPSSVTRIDYDSILINDFVDGNFNEGFYINKEGLQFSKYVDGIGFRGINVNYEELTNNDFKTINFPNASGTIALLSDIPSGGVTSVGLTMPSAFSVTNSPITSSGDIAVTGAGLVSQYVRGDGTLANFPNSTGGGSSVNYYLNGSISQGTFGGDTYYQLSKTPILGAGTNFTRTNGAGNGYIASFITDAGDPSFLNIPGGNWNVEFYFQSSATGGSPQFYAELYKVSATNTFTLVASGSTNPEGITNGTTVEQYYTSIPVPETSLLITDRLAIRIYVITSGRTITLHTENGNLCEVLTTFTTGLTALNGLTDQVQFFDVGTGATNFNISSSGDTHTFNLLFNIRRNANNSSNNNINYNGYAVTGSAESSAVWTITRLTIAASGSITVATATNVAWTNRESATYI